MAIERALRTLRAIELHAAESEAQAHTARELAAGLADMLEGRHSEPPVEPEQPPVPPVEPEPVPPLPPELGYISIRPFEGHLGDVKRVWLNDKESFFARYFQQTRGNVTETICALMNSMPNGNGSIVLEADRLEVYTDAGELMVDDWEWGGEEMIRPAGMRIFTHYRGGTQLDYYAAFADDHATPGPEFDAKLAEAYRIELQRQPDCGPYIMGWPDDVDGRAPGGGGIEPYWHFWRNTPHGRALAAIEMLRTAQREFRCMTDENGALVYNSRAAYTTLDYYMPGAFDEAKKPDELPVWAPTYKRYGPHNDQHLKRATRAAMWLVSLGEHHFASWYLGMLMNFQAAAHLNTAGDGLTDGWWSLSKKLESIETGKRSKFCGRGAVHEADLAHFCRDNGIMVEAATRISGLYDALFLKAMDADGLAFSHSSKATPESHGVDGWEEQDQVAQTRELQLAIPMYLTSGNADLICRVPLMKEALGPMPPMVINFSKEPYEFVGDPNSFYEIMTHGDLSQVGGRKGLLQLAASRGVDAGGAQPLNSCLPRLWLPERQRQARKPSR